MLFTGTHFIELLDVTREENVFGPGTLVHGDDTDYDDPLERPSKRSTNLEILTTENLCPKPTPLPQNTGSLNASMLDEYKKVSILSILTEYKVRGLFASSCADLGKRNVVEHTIELIDKAKPKKL